VKKRKKMKGNNINNSDALRRPELFKQKRLHTKTVLKRASIWGVGRGRKLTRTWMRPFKNRALGEWHRKGGGGKKALLRRHYKKGDLNKKKAADG